MTLYDIHDRFYGHDGITMPHEYEHDALELGHTVAADLEVENIYHLSALDRLIILDGLRHP